MKSFYYSLEKDKTAWWLVLISVIGLFVCYFDIGIQWPPVAKKATEVFSNILVSSLSGCIFYLIVNTVSIYSTRKFKLKVISDALIEMRALIIDLHHHFSCAYNSGNESVIGRSLTQEDKKHLGSAAKDLRSVFDTINTFLDILPSKEIRRFSEIASSNSFALMLYGLYEETFSPSRFHYLSCGMDNIICKINLIEKSIEKLR